MSIYGAMFSGVSGLKAQSQSMSILSDNIANANTVGYKASLARFQTLVTSPATATSYSSGGVLGRPLSAISQQGLLQASSSTTDVGISGRGFFAVTSKLGNVGSGSIAGLAYTRAGSFSIDKNGYLVNSAGYYLLGVATDTQGRTATSNASVQSLQAINVGTLTGYASATTSLSIGANLPAVPTKSTPLTLAGKLDGTTSASDAGPNGAGYVVYSSTGNAYWISQLDYVQTGTNQYDLQIAAGNITPIGSSPAVSSSFPITLASLTVGASGTTVTTGSGLTFSDSSTYAPGISAAGLTLGTANNLASVGVDEQDVTTVVYDSLGVAHNLTLAFSRQSEDPAAAAPPSAQSNAWTVSIKSMTVVSTGASSVSFPTAGGATGFPIYLDGSGATTGASLSSIQASTLSFNTNGTLKSGPTTLPALTMASGAATFGGSSFTLNLGTAGSTSGVTQLSDSFAVSFTNQDGIAYSYRTGIAFSSDGLVSAVTTARRCRSTRFL